jgi:hypothetical protein
VYVTAVAQDGPHGSFDAARCRADQLAREGIWLESLVPGEPREKVAPGAINTLRIVERPF